MNLSSSKIDVLIPVFNAASTIRASVESIRDQRGVDLRIIVVDDGSEDDTSLILQEIAEEDGRVHVLRKPNGGIVDALNFGLKVATAPLLARHDSDDIADPDRLSRQLAFMAANVDCVAVSSYARHISWDGTPTESTARFRPVEEADPFALPSWEPYLLHPFLLARRWALERVGGYRYVKHAEDSDLYWRLREIGRLHVMPEVLGSYRLSPDSISSKSITNGRILAVFSQLAAISARRRASGSTDLAFDKDWVDNIASSRTSSDMVAKASNDLEPTERSYLRSAYAAKLLELTSYRPYELDVEDCNFIRKALSAPLPIMSRKNRRDLSRARAIAVARLVGRGRFRSAAILSTLSGLPEAAVRYAIQLGREQTANLCSRRTAARREGGGNSKSPRRGGL